MKLFNAKCKGVALLWFYSDVYWYVTKKNKKRGDKVGCGKTQDEAYRDFIGG